MASDGVDTQQAAFDLPPVESEDVTTRDPQVRVRLEGVFWAAWVAGCVRMIYHVFVTCLIDRV